MKSDELKRKENESDLEYELRLVEAKKELKEDIDWEDIKNLVGFEGNKDSLRKANDTKFGGYEVYKYMKEKKLKEMEDGEIISKIEELKFERMKNRNQKSELNRLLNKHSKFDLFYENIKESIETLPLPTFDHLQTSDKIGGWILAIADIHYNATFVSENNIYNRDEVKRRFSLLLSEMVELINRNKIEHLEILSLGDEIQGLLRLSDIKLNDISIVDSVVEVSRLITTFLNELSKYVDITYRHNVYSNHTQTRPLGSKANAMPSEDISKLIGNYIKDMLVNNDRVDVILSDKEYATFHLMGQTILFQHGHTERKIEDVIKKYTMLTRKFIDIALLGHFHGGKSFTCGELNGNTEVVVEPSFIGSDPYSDSLGLGSKGMCQLHKIEENKGVTETYRIILN